MSAGDIAEHIETGDVIVAGQVLGEPTVLLEQVMDAVAGADGIRLFVGMSLTDAPGRTPEGVGLYSSVGMGPNAGLIAAGRMHLIPCHMSQLPWLLGDGPLRTDVALVLLSPPDREGWCSLGAASDYGWHALQSARVVMAEINDHVPVVAGDTQVHRDQLAYSVRTSRPLPEYQRAVPAGTDLAIGRHVAGYIRDGCCLSIGIGRLGEAVLQSLADRKDLGVHAGMIGDTMLEMMRAGVITNARKELDTGVSVAGSILGSARALALAAAEPRLRLLSVDQTHAPARIAALSNFVCVNSALEVDVTGNVNSEVVAGRYVGAIGGAVDFLRGALLSPGGRSVVALPASTPKGRSRVVPQVERVTAAGSDVDVVATEYGTAELRGCSAGERARRLIGIAAPEHRPPLLEAAAAAGL